MRHEQLFLLIHRSKNFYNQFLFLVEILSKILFLLVSVDDTDLSKSLISIQSKNVSEVAAEEIENIPVGIAPGNPLLVEVKTIYELDII